MIVACSSSISLTEFANEDPDNCDFAPFTGLLGSALLLTVFSFDKSGAAAVSFEFELYEKLFFQPVEFFVFPDC